MPARIMVVDSITSNRIMLKTRLMADFFDITLADSANSAWALAKTSKPDAIMINTRLSDGDGHSLCARFKTSAECSHIPVIMLARNKNDIDWAKAYSNFADDVQLLPLDLPTLKPRLHSLLRSKTTLEELRRRAEPSQIGLQESGTQFLGKAPRLKNVAFLTPAPSFWQSVVCKLSNNFGIESELYDTRKSQSEEIEADIFVVAEGHSETNETLRLISKLRASELNRKKMVLFMSKPDSKVGISQAYEIGANDAFSYADDPSEVAARIQSFGGYFHAQEDIGSRLNSILKLATMDPLTGLFNRRYAMEYMEQAVDKAIGERKRLIAMMLDLDQFKNINDTYGHASGDMVLAQCARRMSSSLRPTDILARIGGEEFLLIVPNISDLRATKLADRIRKLISDEPFVMHPTGPSISVTMSIGLTSLADGDDVDMMLARADAALYMSKGSGRDRITFQSDAA